MISTNKSHDTLKTMYTVHTCTHTHMYLNLKEEPSLKIPLLLVFVGNKAETTVYIQAGRDKWLP